MLDYRHFWNRLESFGEEFLAATATPTTSSHEQVNAGPNVDASESKSMELPEKIVKTTKIIVGEKTSWAVVQVLGEVREVRVSAVILY